MQSYTQIQPTETLTNSLAEILNNDQTAISCSSGTAFPTTNLLVGMLCFRTDQNKLYELKDATPTWVMLADLSRVPAFTDSPLFTGILSMGQTDTQLYRTAAGALVLKNATGAIVISAAGDAELCFNAYLDSNDQWQRVSTGSVSSRIRTNGATGPVYETAAAGTNPIASWTTNKLWNQANQGPGSGMDADTVDGIQGAALVRSVNGSTPDGTGNVLVSGGAGGGGTDRVFWENDQQVTTNYSITAGKNAMTAGPVSVANGVTVTVPAGSVWTIV